MPAASTSTRRARGSRDTRSLDARVGKNRAFAYVRRHVSPEEGKRVKALNAYLHDIYGRREILKAGVVPVPVFVFNKRLG